MVCLPTNCSCGYHRIFKHLTHGRNEEARLIIKNLENLRDAADVYGTTLLHLSVTHQNIEVTQYLIDAGCNVDVRNAAGITPLMLAIMRKDASMIALLLKSNADIYATDNKGFSTLQRAFYACLKLSRLYLGQNSFCILEMFFDRINRDYFEDKHRLTQILMRASNLEKLVVVVLGSENLARLVIEIGYPMDFVESLNGFTALHCAMILTRMDNVKILIEHGANVDVLDKEGCSPIYCYTLSFQEVDENSEILGILLKKSTRLSVRDKYNLTDVDWLFTRGSKKTVKSLLLSSINIDACLNRSLLYSFVCNSNADVLDLFAELDIEFDVNERLSNFPAPHLIVAARQQCPKTIQFLLEHGADVHYSASQWSSPLQHCIEVFDSDADADAEAREMNKAKVTELLLQYGADAQIIVHDNHLLIEHLSRRRKDKLYTKVIVAHLALLGCLNPPRLNGLTRDKIESGPLKAHFDYCTQQIEELKRAEVYGTVTMFKLLSEKDDKLVAYAHNSELISAFRSAMENVFHLESYYFNSLERRVSKAMDEAKLQSEVSLVIAALTRLCADACHAIIYKIIRYLNVRDLTNLCKIFDNSVKSRK